MQFGWTRRQKPTIGTQIDHTQSLASGLVWFAPLWEGGGSSIVDVVGNVNLAVNSAATWVPGNSPMVGAGLNCPVASSGAAATLPSNLKLQAPVTLVGACRYLPTGSAGDYVISLALNNNGQPEYVAFGLRTSAAGVLSVITADSGAVFTGTGGLTLSAGQDVIVVGVFARDGVYALRFPGQRPTVDAGHPVLRLHGRSRLSIDGADRSRGVRRPGDCSAFQHLFRRRLQSRPVRDRSGCFRHEPVADIQATRGRRRAGDFSLWLQFFRADWRSSTARHPAISRSRRPAPLPMWSRSRRASRAIRSRRRP